MLKNYDHEKKKKRKDGDTALGVTNFITGQSGALGLIILIKTLWYNEQNTVAKLPQFEWAFLAMGKAGKQCKVSLI